MKMISRASFTARAAMNVLSLAALFVVLATPAVFVASFAASSPPPPTNKPNPIIKSLANGMKLLKPVFGVEAQLQANLLGRGVDRTAIENEIDAEIASPTVVIYTYGLSPFSTEALAMLEANCASSSVNYKTIELGAEWFLLNGKDSVKRVALAARCEDQSTSLPKIFINGNCIGGCAELAELVESGQFQVLTKPKVTAAKKEAFANPFAKLFGQT
jgi:glutaredoxin